MERVPGTVYLLHLNPPYKHAKHYLGWTADLQARLAQHADGGGARLLQVARNAGIGWELARTWPGDRHRERQLKKQGGRSRMCPVCKDAKRNPPEKPMQPTTPASPGQADMDGSVIRAELPADLTSTRQARAAVRQALAAWGMDDPSGDAELLASELAANAAQHGKGPITLALRRHAEPGGQPGVTCEVTDASPEVPQPRQAGADAERGRGLAIVAALADGSGVRAHEAGKTSWFTLALAGRARRLAPQPEPQAQLEAGA